MEDIDQHVMKDIDRHMCRIGSEAVGHGCGFFLQTNNFPDFPLIVTAAHCLPQMPPPDVSASLGERTYTFSHMGEDMLAECIFADPIADIALLQPADVSSFPNDDAVNKHIFQWEQSAVGFLIRARPTPPAYLVKNGKLVTCTGKLSDRYLTVEASDPIEGGMSGSPILDERLKPVGVLVQAYGLDDEEHRTSHLNPTLLENLPRWVQE